MSRSYLRMRNFFDIYNSQGATGFFYFDITTPGLARITPETIRWFQELKPEISQKILSQAK